MTRPKIVAILGPTATGKSSLAILLAKKCGGEIISADSRQVYRGLDIATGKVTEEEMNGIPHHLLDVAHPQEQFTVADFVHLGEKAIAHILKREKVPIIAGGTGFYIEALIDGALFPHVPPNEELRAELEKLSAQELVKRLAELDATRLETVDTKNKVRLIRAIEIAETLGSVPAVARGEKYDPLRIGLDMPDDELRESIKARTEERARCGMFDEAKTLFENSLSYERMNALGLEYRILAQWLKGEISKEDALKRIAVADWQYAKRQRTWFKRDARIEWYHPNEKDAVIKRVSRFLQSTQSADSVDSME
ncbi:tRNA (adenosine(37)-N6)-dimethylallyltransferase MiaA [Candidatus Kaiserbacteria bacterium CG10_big_fil_rev_8_21_14_0_10_49_17]|uniref:tRNA dimethylallyltransferase n=1 Tax=Candidatus Kaiserbacteria bacterium CG10_big_fil_rev_8_21_14_0_10_49_17 TaxID=1974609 RepID=A0A2M6WFB8_9BACT|nr:MAG: tRNA (adenosine(37)-N6)-dimethylallyltransferase MiaA [Candidatus Kaiserbacteria bacterium CG10_big_fil_rev_8_21_14_0_10_49_17]